jgi:cell wall-associated NlpC family hydrolase
VGVYIGGNMFISAETGSMQRVNECSLDNSYWSAAFMTARRVI